MFCKGLWRTARDVKRIPDVKEFYIGFLGFLCKMRIFIGLGGVKEFYRGVNLFYRINLQGFWYSLFLSECVVTNARKPSKVR